MDIKRNSEQDLMDFGMNTIRDRTHNPVFPAIPKILFCICINPVFPIIPKILFCICINLSFP